MTDWLDDEDEEQTVHATGMLVPEATPPRVRGRGDVAATATVSSFDDDDWNW